MIKGRKVTKKSDPKKNKYLKAREEEIKKHKFLKVLSEKTGIGKKALERKINEKAAKKSLKKLKK